jgi:hypothetical protein
MKVIDCRIPSVTLLVMLIVAFVPGCGKKSSVSGPDFSQSASVTAILGEPEQDSKNGIRHSYWVSDGKTSLAMAGDLPCRRLKREDAEQGFIYFSIDPTFKRRNYKNVIIEVEYFDETAAKLTLEYDGSKRNSKDGAYKPTSSLNLEGSKTWQLALFRVTRATFANAQNSKSDFRLSVTPADLYVRRVTVTRETEPDAMGHWAQKGKNFAKAGGLEVALGEPAKEYDGGIQHLYFVPDGRTVPTRVEGVPCRRPAIQTENAGYFYFRVDPSFKKSGARDVEVEIEYFDDSRGSFGLEFDGSRSPEAMNEPYHSADVYGFSGSKLWRTATFNIRSASFRNAQNGGADFRLWASPPVMFLRKVTLNRRTALSETEKPR